MSLKFWPNLGYVLSLFGLWLRSNGSYGFSGILFWGGLATVAVSLFVEWLHGVDKKPVFQKEPHRRK